MTRKAINMATVFIMSLPPYLRANDESDKEIKKSDGNLKREPAGIGAYDIDTPDSARKGLPSRLLSPTRTRFTKGKEVVKPILLPGELDVPSSEDWEEMTAPDKGDVVWLNNKDKKELIRLNIKKENSDTYGKLSTKEKDRIKQLEKKAY